MHGPQEKCKSHPQLDTLHPSEKLPFKKKVVRAGRMPWAPLAGEENDYLYRDGSIFL